MHTTHVLNKVMACALLAGSIGAVGVGGGAGIANANDGPFTWCPGQSMDWPTGPDVTRVGIRDDYVWDMGICHTWYKVDWGFGNVPRIMNGAPNLHGSNIWDGDDPPPPNPTGFNCSPFWCPVPPHDDPNFH